MFNSILKDLFNGSPLIGAREKQIKCLATWLNQMKQTKNNTYVIKSKQYIYINKYKEKIVDINKKKKMNQRRTHQIMAGP